MRVFCLKLVQCKYLPVIIEHMYSGAGRRMVRSCMTLSENARCCSAVVLNLCETAARRLRYTALVDGALAPVCCISQCCKH
jgi:hypothetical protein